MTVLRVKAEPTYVTIAEIRHDHADCETDEAFVDDALHVYCRRHGTYQIAD